MSTASQSGSADRPVISADVPLKFMGAVKKRIGKSIPVGNEGAGTAVAAVATANTSVPMCKAVWNWNRVRRQPKALYQAPVAELQWRRSVADGQQSQNGKHHDNGSRSCDR